MRKYWIALLTCTIMFLACGLSVSAAEAILWEERTYLTEEEHDECLDALQAAADRTGMNVAVILGSKHRSDSATETLTKNTYLELFGEHSDGLIYYVDLDGIEPYDYIATRGMGQFYYTNSNDYDRISAMFSTLNNYLYPVGSEDVEGLLYEFASLVEYYYDAGVPDERYYVYDDVWNCYLYLEDGEILRSARKPYIDWDHVIFMGLCGAGIGLVIAAITYFGVKSRYKFKSSLSPTAYVNRKNVIYHQQYDNYIRTYTRKVKIESSSGGGGGGGGGGFSSGGFGGGGNHR